MTKWQKYYMQKKNMTPMARYRLAKARISYLNFFEKIRKFIAAEFHKEIITYLEDPTELTILIKMPRGHGKSTLGCENFVAHYGAYHPGKFCLIFSRTENQALARGKAIKYILKTTEGYSHLTRAENTAGWGAKEFTLTNNFFIKMAGAGGSIAGTKHEDTRPDLIILDDVVPENEGGTMTDAKIEKWWDETIVNLGHPKTKIVILGTPYRQSDLIAVLSKPVKDKMMLKFSKAIKVLHYEALKGKDIKALEDDKTEVLWPKERNLAYLRQKYYGEMRKNALVFARQYLCRTVAEGSKLYPLKYIEQGQSLELSFAMNNTEFKYDYDDIVIGVDLASSNEVGADYFVAFVLGITSNGRFHVLWIERHRGLSLNKQKALILRLMERYQPSCTSIEDNGYQAVFANDMAEISRYTIHRHTTTTKKHDLLVGLPTVRAHLENKRILYPCNPDQPDFTQMTFEEFLDTDGNPKIQTLDYGGDSLADNLDILFDEMSGFQYIDEKWVSVMQHDDTVFGQWFAVLAAEKTDAYKVTLLNKIDQDTDRKTGIQTEYLPIEQPANGNNGFNSLGRF